MPRFATRSFALLACSLLAATLPGLRPALAAEGVPLAIKGYDPVAYFALQRATPGVPEFVHDWDEHRWQFSNARHRDLFKADPVRYAPQFANFCAVALSRGEVREANPEYWVISDGRLYLFGKSVGPDVFRKNPDSLDNANKNRGLLPKKR